MSDHDALVEMLKEDNRRLREALRLMRQELSGGRHANQVDELEAKVDDLTEQVRRLTSANQAAERRIRELLEERRWLPPRPRQPERWLRWSSAHTTGD